MASVAQAKHIVGKLKVKGPSQITQVRTRTVADATYTVVAIDYGTTIFFTYAGGVTVTLPATIPLPGTEVRCVNANSNTTSISVATDSAGTLVTFNDATADSVAFASGQRIGSVVRCISNGTNWMAVNENGACAMTVT